ncbi:NAD(P)/FAD-dependent oxidoreductase [Phocaeicola plebeius]|uniref:NAD(P)/FAD-dependent oxidoreductase n=1 Tax=Phocaeicola plebeius TaxID=310297 RepID=UPI0026EE6D1C|nr:FAD-binding protein [Phocaeicola plebeius]
MIHEYQLRILPEQAASEQSLKQYIGREKGLDVRTINAIRILKRSIDARQRTIYVNLTIRVFVNETPSEEEFVRTDYPNIEGRPAVIVVGAGPGGLFAALKLIELGLRPIVVERGKNVRERKEDLARISREHKVDAESNYSFGEGGAGAYSDGKLYTRSKKRGSVEKILNVFCQHGASPTILSDAHPHIGTDKLPRVIENMRNTILACGGEVHFQTRMESILIEGQKVKGIETNTGKTFLGPVILATGHSARDVYRWLYAHGVQLETKGIAIGVRLEHPSMLIDQIQYHNKNGRGKYLPAAEYSFVQQVDGRGVYSFCMCPGGFVVPAASGPHQLVVNGMSPSNRGTKWSNSGMVVETRPEDLLLPEMQLQAEPFPESNESLTEELILRDGKQPEGTIHTLAMMRFQEKLEQICWQQGNMRQTAPSQRMVDFTRKKLSYDLPATSYSPGLVSSPLHFWMPSFLSERLSKGFQLFGKSSRGFLTNEAVMIAVETRTSSPVRIVRDKDTLQHLTMEGLFPCGEGAGYAGGIVSAGIDGERCAEAVANYLNH